MEDLVFELVPTFIFGILVGVVIMFIVKKSKKDI